MLSPNDILGPDGRIAKRLENYEHRAQQMTMAEGVWSAIENESHLIVVDSTGNLAMWEQRLSWFKRDQRAIQAGCEQNKGPKRLGPDSTIEHAVLLYLLTVAISGRIGL